MSDEATICISRRSKYTARLRKFKVLVDEVDVGRIRNGETARFPIAPGRHTIRLKIDWCGSKPRIVDARPGETVRFTCGTTDMLSGILAIFTSRNDYLELVPDDTAPEAPVLDAPIR